MASSIEKLSNHTFDFSIEEPESYQEISKYYDLGRDEPKKEKTLEDLYLEDLRELAEIELMYGTQKALYQQQYSFDVTYIANQPTSAKLMPEKQRTGLNPQEYKTLIKLGGLGFAKRIIIAESNSESSRNIVQTKKVEANLKKIPYCLRTVAEDYKQSLHESFLEFLETKPDGIRVNSIAPYLYHILCSCYLKRHGYKIPDSIDSDLKNSLNLTSKGLMKTKYELESFGILSVSTPQKKKKFKQRSNKLKAKEIIYKLRFELPKGISLNDAIKATQSIQKQYGFELKGDVANSETLAILGLLEVLLGHELPSKIQFIAAVLNRDPSEGLVQQVYKKIVRLQQAFDSVKDFIKSCKFTKSSPEVVFDGWSKQEILKDSESNRFQKSSRSQEVSKVIKLIQTEKQKPIKRISDVKLETSEKYNNSDLIFQSNKALKVEIINQKSVYKFGYTLDSPSNTLLDSLDTKFPTQLIQSEITDKFDLSCSKCIHDITKSNFQVHPIFYDKLTLHSLMSKDFNQKVRKFLLNTHCGSIKT